MDNPEIIALSITRAFSSSPVIRALLRSIGFTVNSVNRLINDEGFSSAKEISLLKPKDIADALDNVNRLFGNKAGNSRIYFNAGKITKLQSLCAYLRRCKTANRIPDVCLITQDNISTYVDHYDLWTSKGDSIQDVMKNNIIKFDSSNFTRFRQRIETLLAGTKSPRGVTLDYLIRNEENNPRNPIEESEPDIFSKSFMKENTSFRGIEFKTDNQSLYIILRYYLTDTPAWNIISKYSNENDGRKSYLALRKHYEGASYYDLMKSQASSMLLKTFFRGDTQKFPWERFIAIHLEAHRIFEDINEPLTESMKIMYLKTAIRPEAGLEASLEVAKNLPDINVSFDAFSNHLTSSVTNKRSRSEMMRITSPRMVAGSEATESSRRTGRGRGRGGRFNQSGRFPGRGRGRGGRKSAYNSGPTYNSANYNNSKVPETIHVDGKTLYPRRIYQRSEYSQLTPSQKAELYKARSVTSAVNTTDDNSTIDSRQISSNLTEIRDMLKTRSSNSDSCGDNEKSSENDDSITSQFRKRRNHNN